MKTRDTAGPLWAVTSFFNPAGYRNRLRNYRVFREHLQLPLLAVELSFNGVFELQDQDAEIVLRWRAGDVMWQKERLLNSAWSRLPAHCSAVAWLDCDIVFVDADWPAQALARLRHAHAVHAFARALHLAEHARVLRPHDVRGVHTSVQLSPFRSTAGNPADAATGGPFAGVLGRGDGAPNAGLAWVARRDWIGRVRLFDRCVAGGGDTAWGAALLGRPADAVALHAMNAAQQDCYLQWAGQLALEGEVGCLTGDLLHLWHGDLRHRRSQQRHQRLSASGFDPRRDLRADRDEPWRWTDPHAPAAAWLRDYFHARQEDGAR